MLLRTSRGETLTAQWADTAASGTLYMMLDDDRRLPEIAADMDGLEWIERISPEEGDKTFAGNTLLVSIARTAQGVQISLTREAVQDG